MSNQIYDTHTLSELYKLGITDIERIICSDGRLCFSLTDEKFLVYIPLFQKCVAYANTYKPVLDRLTPSAFHLEPQDMFLTVTATREYPSAFLGLPTMVDLLETHLDVTEDTALLLSRSSNAPLFIGHRNVINRLADDFEKIDGTVLINDFLEWRGSHV